MINKELIDNSNEYLFIHGRLSIPFLQCKLKVSYSMAKEIMEYLKQPF